MRVSPAPASAQFDVAAWTSAPLQLETCVILPAPPADVFRSLTDPDELCRIFGWMHDITIERSEADVIDELGVLRRCHFGNGVVLEEIIVGWEPPHSYAYRGVDETHPFGMRGHLGVVSCAEAEGGSTELHWQHYFDHCNPAAMRQQLDESMTAAVHSLVNYHN